MPTDFNPLNVLMRDGPIPPVDPADLKSVWVMMEGYKKDFEKLMPDRAPNETFSVRIDCYRQACSPGADVGAVWYRLSMLEMLKHLNEAGGPTLPGMNDSKPSDALFKAFAIVPMTALGPGGRREGFPFDMDELTRLVKKESEA
jgi:hypothetical protein